MVLRLLVGEPRPQAERALGFVSEARNRGDETVVSDIVVSETYFALQYHYGVPKGEAPRQLRNFFESADIVSSGCAPEVLQTPRLASAKPGFVDRVIHAGYLRKADRLVSFDRSANKLDRSIVLR